MTGKHGIGSPISDYILTAWQCSFEYIDGENNCRNSDIVYKATDAADAVDSARRWLNGRMKDVPEFYKRFIYFQISPYPIGPISETGQYQTGGSFRIMEWSRDRAGVDMDIYCDWKIEEYSRKSEKEG